MNTADDPQSADRRARRNATVVAVSVVMAVLVVPPLLLWLLVSLVSGGSSEEVDRARPRLEGIVDAVVDSTSLARTDVPDMPGYTWDPVGDCVGVPCPSVSVTMNRSDARNATFSLMALASLSSASQWCPGVFQNLEVPDESFGGACVWELPRNTAAGPWRLTLTLDAPDVVTLTVALQESRRAAAAPA